MAARHESSELAIPAPPIELTPVVNDKPGKLTTRLPGTSFTASSPRDHIELVEPSRLIWTLKLWAALQALSAKGSRAFVTRLTGAP